MAEPRSLHLHTLESLLADLVSGRSVVTGSGQPFLLPDNSTRSALDWYRKKGAATWEGVASVQLTENLVDSCLLEPPELDELPARPDNANARRLRLKKLEAHRFAGLHKFGKIDAPPKTFVHLFHPKLTLLEGRNGSGKTSLVNAIIWALTGELLRPQRTPEAADDFQCWISEDDRPEEQTAHKLSPVTPMPNINDYRPDKAWVPADTWVELTFVDETGTEFPPVRRSQNRTPLGKLQETEPDLGVLGVDPIALRIGTIMPGLLPLIRVGSESELGQAVAQLTGLASLVGLADHVRRAKSKIEKEFVKAKTIEREKADADYEVARGDLNKILTAHPSAKPEKEIPCPAIAEGVEEQLTEINKHFEDAKATAFEAARTILGDRFDPTNLLLLADLEKNISRALERASQPGALPEVSRLDALGKLGPDEITVVEEKIVEIITEAEALQELSKDPTAAARIRLYARIATWISDHPDPERKEEECVVCNSNISHAVDPITRRPLIVHMQEAASNAELLSLTLTRWSEAAHGDLIRKLPASLRTELGQELPTHPCDLLRTAILSQLFAFEPFKGVLGELKGQAQLTFDEVAKSRADLSEVRPITLPEECAKLAETLKRLDKAIRFAKWRLENEKKRAELTDKVVGRLPKEGEARDESTLTGKLLRLQDIVKAAQPISDAITHVGRMKRHLEARRASTKRLGEYEAAVKALGNLASLGTLADEQVNQLRITLRQDAAAWRNKIYLGAFPDTAHELVDAAMGRKGELDLVVKTGGVSAPAQHVTNASALRASLVAFYFAFWEYVLRERGGITTLILDDPQELLDDENRERFGKELATLVANGAQLVVTSYDARFSSRIARLQIAGGLDHLEVHPATRQQPVVRLTFSLPVIEVRKVLYERDVNAEEPARSFADGCRAFLEAKLGDLFDDPAHAAWAIANPDPTLSTFVQRLRPLVKAGPQGMFSAHVFRRFVDHPALVDGSPVLELMNKAHHGRRNDIRAADVASCAKELSELLQITEQMYEEGYRWRRRDAAQQQAAPQTFLALSPMPAPSTSLSVCPDLAAFTQETSGSSQATLESLDPNILSSKAAYFLRRPNFGFAAPAGSLALVEAVPGAAADRRLVIVRNGATVYARRLVRGAASEFVGLTAEVPDPRTRTPKTIFLSENEVAIHQVVGIIFDHSIKVEHGKDEAVLVEESDLYKKVEITFRVKDESAVPLALSGQVVLGGPRIDLSQLTYKKDSLVALALDDGSSIFKRVGNQLPGDLSHLSQFESVGGLGSSQVLAVGKQHKGLKTVVGARVVVGVLYNA